MPIELKKFLKKALRVVFGKFDACHQTLSIYELLEAIVLCLDPSDLCISRLVARN